MSVWLTPLNYLPIRIWEELFCKCRRRWHVAMLEVCVRVFVTPGSMSVCDPYSSYPGLRPPAPGHCANPKRAALYAPPCPALPRPAPPVAGTTVFARPTRDPAITK